MTREAFMTVSTDLATDIRQMMQSPNLMVPKIDVRIAWFIEMYGLYLHCYMLAL